MLWLLRTVAFLPLLFSITISIASPLKCCLACTAELQIDILHQALDLFRVKYGRYPTEAEGLQILTERLHGRKPIMERIPVDPWNHPYVYKHTAEGITVRSPGLDAPDDRHIETKTELWPVLASLLLASLAFWPWGLGRKPQPEGEPDGKLSVSTALFDSGR